MALKHLHSTTTAPKRRAWIWLILVPIVLLAAGEGIARMVRPAAAQDSGLREILTRQDGRVTIKPDSTFKARSGEIRINSLGLRGDLPDSERIKIAVIGGDSVFNGQVAEQNRTLCGILETGLSLNRSSNRFQFINAGLPSQAGSETRDLVAKALVPNGVQAVVILIGHEDIKRILNGGTSPEVAPTPVVNKGEPAQPSWSALWDVLASYATSTGDDTTVSTTPYSEDPSALLNKGLSSFARNLRALVRECRMAKMGVVVATEPCMLLSENPELVKVRSETATAMGTNLVSMARIASTIRSLMDAMASVDRSVVFADLARAISQSSVVADPAARSDQSKELSFYADPDPVLGYGLTEAGIEVLARNLERVLLQARIWGSQRLTIGIDPIVE